MCPTSTHATKDYFDGVNNSFQLHCNSSYSTLQQNRPDLGILPFYNRDGTLNMMYHRHSTKKQLKICMLSSGVPSPQRVITSVKLPWFQCSAGIYGNPATLQTCEIALSELREDKHQCTGVVSKTCSTCHRVFSNECFILHTCNNLRTEDLCANIPISSVQPVENDVDEPPVKRQRLTMFGKDRRIL
jgi:hypothetical protein